jgi:hypothetical protein
MQGTAHGAAALCLMSVTALGADLGLPAPVVPLESLIESFIELMSQVFMLPIFHRRTSC